MAESDETSWLEPTPVEPLQGQEPFSGVGATVAEFWRWSFSDLRSNIVRGILAEFLVAKAVGARELVRVAWDNFDVVSAARTRIEVKSSAYLQSWSQRRLSTITFTGLTGLRWDAKEGWGDDREVRADGFVFAIQTCREPALYDPLDVDQGFLRTHCRRRLGLCDTQAFGLPPAQVGCPPASRGGPRHRPRVHPVASK